MNGYELSVIGFQFQKKTDSIAQLSNPQITKSLNSGLQNHQSAFSNHQFLLGSRNPSFPKIIIQHSAIINSYCIP